MSNAAFLDRHEVSHFYPRATGHLVHETCGPLPVHLHNILHRFQLPLRRCTGESSAKVSDLRIPLTLPMFWRPIVHLRLV